jgi:drug/metabolite transporter (DMT)-like permease
MNTQVKIGTTTVVGWATALLGALPIIVKSIEEGEVAFHGPEKYLALLSVVSLAVTQLGRYAQAHALIRNGIVLASKAVASVPVAEVEKLVEQKVAGLLANVTVAVHPAAREPVQPQTPVQPNA